MNQYYVYFLLDPRKEFGKDHLDYEPFYLGKGKGGRWKAHLKETEENFENRRKFDRIQEIRKDGLEPVCFFFIQEIKQDEAYKIETSLIKKYGRIDYDKGGILTNICRDNKPPTDGRSHLGKIHSDKTKKFLSDLRKGKTYEEIYGEEKAKELRIKRSTQKPPMEGKRHTKEARKKISEANKRRGPPSPESNRKRSLTLKGRKTSDGMLGKKHKEETKKKMSKASKGIPKSESHRAELSRVRQRKYRITNSSTRKEYIVLSKELPVFCREHGLNYCNLMKAKVENRIFKKVWFIIELSDKPIVKKLNLR